jgi:integrase
VLDFCDLDPNPARNKKVKVPSADDEEVVVPSNEEWLAIQRTLRPRSSLVVRLVECEGLRISEAVGLLYGDVDFARGLIRVSKARTKKRTAGQRWLPVPRELMDELAALCPLEDRHRERRVFPDLSDWNVRQDLELACRDAEIAHYWPHTLRHRRCSLWLAHGFETMQIKVWSGHSKASLLTDIYGHVVIDARQDAWREFWVGVYMDERRERVGLHGERETA